MAGQSQNPYEELEARAYWRTAVADVGADGISGLWQPKFRITPLMRFVTAGSCFAQHIGRALAERRYGWFDAEPVMAYMPEDMRRAYGYGVFSFRTGNIYTPKMLCQWLEAAVGDGALPSEIWEEGGRYYDPLRPKIEPEGFVSPEELTAARAATLAAIRLSVETADVFVFTLGLTEHWYNAETGMEYALCPGTAGGVFDPALHKFGNHDFVATHAAMRRAVDLMAAANPNLKVLLTVSPVPLTATATGGHVLTATTYSKSVLRAVAGQIVAEYPQVDYFPSYEIITAPVFGGRAYQANQRTVAPEGVAGVMDRFFADQLAAFGPIAKDEWPPKPKRARKNKAPAHWNLACEEEILAAFAPGQEAD